MVRILQAKNPSSIKDAVRMIESGGERYICLLKDCFIDEASPHLSMPRRNGYNKI
jgi:hypothetical protein